MNDGSAAKQLHIFPYLSINRNPQAWNQFLRDSASLAWREYIAAHPHVLYYLNKKV